MNKQLQTAEYWRSLGIAVLPIQYRSKQPDGVALKQAGYEHGSWQALQSQLPTEQALRLWFSGPQRNVAVITGWQGLVVIDFDTLDAYDAWLLWAQSAGEIAQAVAAVTYRVFTRRGVHVYIAVDEAVPAYHVGAIDIKAAGGYVLAPPSIHPSGAQYTEPKEFQPVVRIERLEHAFPFGPPVSAHHQRGQVVLTSGLADPWDWRPTSATERGVSVINGIRDHVSILDFFPGAQQTRADGRWYIAHCPFHQDDNPSLWIDTKHRLCGCLAGCTEKPMDVINLYQRLRGCDQATAIAALRGAA